MYFSFSVSTMRNLTLCLYLVAFIFITSDARISGGGGRSGGSGRSSGSSGRGYGGSSSSSGYGSRSWGSNSGTSRGTNTGTSGSSWGSSGHSSGSTSWGSHSSSSGLGSKPSSSYGSQSSGSPNYGWRTAVTNPNYGRPTSNTQHQSSNIPLTTGIRSSPKPTSRPQVYNRNTPRPITKPKPVDNKLQQSGSPNSHSRGHNTTAGIGFGRTNDRVEKHHMTNTQTSRFNGTGGTRNPYSPSAPPLSSAGSNLHAPSAPPAPGLNPHAPSAPTMNSGSQQPGPAGWKPGVTNDPMQKQHVTNNQNTYPGQYPNQPPPPYGSGPYPQNPPPYGSNPYPQINPSYGNNPYPHSPPPYGSPYPQGHYPNHPPPAYHPTGTYYPVQQGGSYYPAPPPPPPGYSPYGMPYYKDRSGIRGSDVVAGLALWELMRHSHNHNSYGVQHIHHYHDGGGSGGNVGNYGGNYADGYNNYQPTYHDTMRERYTTRVTPNPRNDGSSSAYNILEMTHYITPDEKGEIYSSEGNMTCISVYNARSITKLHQKQVEDFHKQFPNYTYPLYLPENDTMAKEFTILPGRVIHREPISITCCGVNYGKVDLNLLTNGKHPNVNCLNQIGHIPIKKLTFIKTTAVAIATKPGEWHPIETTNYNNTSPVPLASFPTNWNVTSASISNNSNINTTASLAPFFSSINTTTVPLEPFPNTINTSVPLAPFPSTSDSPTTVPLALYPNNTNITTSVPLAPYPVNLTVSAGSANGTNDSTDDTVSVTNNPSDLIIE